MLFPFNSRQKLTSLRSAKLRRNKASRKRTSRRVLCEQLEARRLLAADLLLDESFESGEWNGAWLEDGQNDWFVSSQRSFDGNSSAEVDGRASDAALTLADPIDLTGYDGAELTYAWRIKKNWDAGEYMAMDVFSGGSWQEAARLSGNVDAENTWHEVTVDLGSHLAEDFKIRFRASVSGNREDGNVDDVKIVGTSVGSEFSIGDVYSNEGDSGTTEFSFTVTRGGDTSAAVSVGYATADGTATTGDNDYVAAAGQLNFAAGEIEKMVTVDVLGDSVVEGAETFTVNLSSPSFGGSIVDGVGEATILNDDGADLGQFELSSLLATNGGDGSAGAVISGFQANGELGDGNSLSVAGDFNGDGINDILVGVDHSAYNATQESSAYVVFGSAGGIGAEFDLASLDGTNGFRIDSSLDASILRQNEYFGDTIESAGDINGDGYDDIIVGAPEAKPEPGSSDQGSAYVILGTSSFGAIVDVDDLDGSNGFKIAGNTTLSKSTEAASIVGTAGDINGDGYSDILLQGSSVTGGLAWVVFGSDEFGTASAAAEISLAEINGLNGFMMESFGRLAREAPLAGDFNGDGIDDLARGNSDRISIIMGRQATALNPTPFGASIDLLELDGTNGFNIASPASGNLPSSSVRSAGDLNHDGVDDIIMTAFSGDPVGKPNAGETYVVFGQSSPFPAEFDLATLDGTNGFYIAGANEGDGTISVSGIGDFNSDGIDDVAIVAVYTDPANGIADAGAIYVLYGNGNSFPATMDLAALSPAQGMVFNGFRELGWLTRMGPGSGDVNGDGRPDFIAGARRADPSGIENAGELYVVYGREASEPPVETDPTLNITNSTVTEPASGIVNMVFTVSLSEASDFDVQFDYASSDVTATAGADYQAISGTVTILAGQTSATLTVPVNADQPLEPTETLAVSILNPSNALLGFATGTGTIIDYVAPTEFYVADNVAPAIYKYEADGTYLGNYHGSFQGNFHTRGIASTPDGTEIFYILSDGTVLHNRADGTTLMPWVADEVVKPDGIATDGEHIWIADRGTDKVYFYEQGALRTEVERVSSTSSFALAKGNRNPRGITTDGTNLWVVNSKSAKDEVFKYTTSGALVGRWTIDAANVNPRGITVDPNNVDDLWIVDSTTDSVYQYSGAASRTSGIQPADGVFALASGNTRPEGIASPGVASSAMASSSAFFAPPISMVASGTATTLSDSRVANSSQLSHELADSRDEQLDAIEAADRVLQAWPADIRLIGEAGVTPAEVSDESLLDELAAVFSNSLVQF